MQDESGGTNSDNGSVLNAHTVLVAQNLVVQESAGQAGGIAQGVYQFSLLVALHVDDAMIAVHAHVRSFDGDLHRIAHTAAANDVVALLQRKYLFEAEHVLDDCDAAERILVFPFVHLFLLARGLCLELAEADGELFLAMFADKDQGLAFAVLGFVKSQVVLALGTTDTFHVSLFFLQNPRILVVFVFPEAVQRAVSLRLVGVGIDADAHLPSPNDSLGMGVAFVPQ